MTRVFPGVIFLLAVLLVVVHAGHALRIDCCGNFLHTLAVANAEVQDKMVKVYGVGGIRGF